MCWKLLNRSSKLSTASEVKLKPKRTVRCWKSIFHEERWSFSMFDCSEASLTRNFRLRLSTNFDLHTLMLDFFVWEGRKYVLYASTLYSDKNRFILQVHWTILYSKNWKAVLLESERWSCAVFFYLFFYRVALLKGFMCVLFCALKKFSSICFTGRELAMILCSYIHDL